MNLGKLAGQAKKMIDKRGGIKSVEEDAMELKNIVGEKGSLVDKAKAAAEAIKDPGAPGEPDAPATKGPPGRGQEPGGR